MPPTIKMVVQGAERGGRHMEVAGHVETGICLHLTVVVTGVHL